MIDQANADRETSHYITITVPRSIETWKPADQIEYLKSAHQLAVAERDRIETRQECCRLLQHLASLKPPRGERADKAMQIAGIDPRSASAFIGAMVGQGLINAEGGYDQHGKMTALFITDAGRAALAELSAA